MPLIVACKASMAGVSAVTTITRTTALNACLILPLPNATNSLSSSFGCRGSVLYAGGKGVLGTNPSGTCGAGTRLKDISFVAALCHIIRLNYFSHTNNIKMASYITGRQTTDNSGRAVYRNMTDFNAPQGTYLTTRTPALS